MRIIKEKFPGKGGWSTVSHSQRRRMKFEKNAAGAGMIIEHRFSTGGDNNYYSGNMDIS